MDAIKSLTTGQFFIDENNDKNRLAQKCTFIALTFLATFATDKIVRPQVNSLVGMLTLCAGTCFSDAAMKVVVSVLCLYAIVHTLSAAKFYATAYDSAPKSIQEFIPMPMFLARPDPV